MAISGNDPFRQMILQQLGQSGGGEGDLTEEEMFAQAFASEEQAFGNILQGFGGGENEDPMEAFLQLVEQGQQQGFNTGSTGDPVQDIFNIAQQSGLVSQGETLENIGIDNFQNHLDSILQNGLAAGEIGQLSVLDSSESALTNSAIQQLGMELGLDINEWANEVNIDLDLDNLQTRANYGVFMKQVEEYLLDETVTEKLENLFFDLEKTEMQNRFSLAKTAAGAARYG